MKVYSSGCTSQYFFTLLWMIGQGIVNLFLSPILYQINLLFTIPILSSAIIALDKLSRNAIDPRKMFLLGILVCGYFLTDLEPTNVITSIVVTMNQKTITSIGAQYYWNLIAIAGEVGTFFYFTLLIFYQTRKQQRNASRWILVGGLFYGPIAFISILFRLNTIIPGIFGFSVAIGLLIISLSLFLNPVLNQVLMQTRKKIEEEDNRLFSYTRSLIEAECGSFVNH